MDMKETEEQKLDGKKGKNKT